MPARGQIDRWKRGLKSFNDLIGGARCVGDKLVGGKDVGIGNVTDVSPVEKVGIIADLEMGPALLEDFGKARYRLSVPRTLDWRVSGRYGLGRGAELTRKCPQGEERQLIDRQLRWLQ